MAKCICIQEAASVNAGAPGSSSAFSAGLDYHAADLSTYANHWKLHIMNATYCGAMTEELRVALPGHISTTIAADPAWTIFIFMPPTALRGETENRHPMADALRKVEEVPPG